MDTGNEQIQKVSTAICFSVSTMGFYPQAWIDDDTYGDVRPADLITLTDDERKYRDFMPPSGKILGSANGRPVWIDIPLPTKQQQIAGAEAEKQFRLDEAIRITADWRTELALGIISPEDRTRLILWMDYLKKLKVVDTSTAPNIKWIEMPE